MFGPPDYKKSKGSDVVGSLISLFDTKDVFIKEFQNVRLLELLKLRFGEGALQACEVMLRDVRESKVIDRNIQDGMNLPQLGSDIQTPRTGPPATPKLHAKILSHLFWPELHEGSFHVPDKIVELQERYEKGFEHLKQSRKLTWLQALGQVNVELEFDDRSNVVVEEVQTWQASVIYAFQDSDDVSGDTVTRTVSQLITQLEMDEGLVRNALVFWVGKFVLREIRKDEFTVLETRDAAEMGGNSQGARQAAVAAAEASASVAAEMSTSVKSADEVATDKLKMYWQFIVGMLTNGGAMPLQQIVMMLKFTVTGGFPFSDEDLREFLRKMVAEGNLEMTGDRYKIRQ
ncbi:MAG: hypothetical protein M1837_002966 [Sclerophora amabilis]|nr:MAG: hypothetical protein M1837_002966 [Sclerophora amabilis]